MSSANPPLGDQPIVVVKQLDNLIVTPHTAWSSSEARQRYWSKSKPTLTRFSAASREIL